MKSPAYIANDTALAEINNTLAYSIQSRRKSIGIFLPNGAGDIMTAMSVLKYKDKIWYDKNIIWFCNMPNADVFRYGLVSEVRTYQWEGIEVDPNTQLKDENNRLRKDKTSDFIETQDLEEAYFPAPWMYSVTQRHGMELPNISKRCFGIPSDWAWHPCLMYSPYEYAMIRDMCNNLPFKYTIMLETFGGSGQSGWDDDLTRKTIKLCREVLGDCNFIFACDKYVSGNEIFPKDIISQKGMLSLSNLTIRQVALANDYSDLFIGVSSGVSVATSRWHAKPTPKIQYCNSIICSTSALANGDFTLVAPTPDINHHPKNKKDEILKIRYLHVLKNQLNKIK